MKKLLFFLFLALLVIFATVHIADTKSSKIIQLANNSYDDIECQINKNGWVVWAGKDGPKHEIFLYDGLNTVQLTYDDYDDIEPKISANGYIVWTGYDGTDNEIYLAAPPLPNLKSSSVPSASGLAPGTYAFYFAVYMAMNGAIDAGQAFYDKVKVTINP